MSVRVVGLMVAVLALAGCAGASKPDAMIGMPVTATHKSGGSVSLVVSGGKPTSSMGMSQISDEDFALALQGSIEKSGLFSRVASEPGSYYRLQAHIGKLDQPVFAMASTVTMEVGYALTDLRSKETLWKKTIASTYTAELKEAYIGVKRLRLANEGAARENIRLMLEEISALSLP